MRKFGAIVFTAIMLAVLVEPNMVSASSLSSEDHSVASIRPDQKALDTLAAAVEKNPNDVDARCALAGCYESLGLPDLAQEQYSAAIQVAPNNAHLWMLRVKQELKNGHPTLATKLIEKLTNDSPTILKYCFGMEMFLLLRAKMMMRRLPIDSPCKKTQR